MLLKTDQNTDLTDEKENKKMMNKTELKTKELKELMKEKLEELKMGEVELVAGGVDIDAAVRHLVCCEELAIVY